MCQTSCRDHYKKKKLKNLFRYKLLKKLSFLAMVWYDFDSRKTVKNRTSRCQFHQHFMYEFFVRTSFFYVHVTRNVTFVRKIRTFNVDEIDYRTHFGTVRTAFHHYVWCIETSKLVITKQICLKQCLINSTSLYHSICKKHKIADKITQIIKDGIHTCTLLKVQYGILN